MPWWQSDSRNLEQTGGKVQAGSGLPSAPNIPQWAIRVPGLTRQNFNGNNKLSSSKHLLGSPFVC